MLRCLIEVSLREVLVTVVLRSNGRQGRKRNASAADGVKSEEKTSPFKNFYQQVRQSRAQVPIGVGTMLKSIRSQIL